MGDSELASGSSSTASDTPLFYLSKVRGIPDHYNTSDMALGIKGTYCMHDKTVTKAIVVGLNAAAFVRSDIILSRKRCAKFACVFAVYM